MAAYFDWPELMAGCFRAALLRRASASEREVRNS